MSEISELYKLYQQYPSIQTDSRKVDSGDLFFALKGPNFDGNRFAEKAIELGAARAIVDDWQLAKKSEMYIYVDDVLECLQQLARYHRLQFKIPFLAITGSNGKTTTKELIYAVLANKYKITATKGNLNNHIGVPLTLLSIPKDAEMALIEMGANHQKEIDFYCALAIPNYGLITNCGKAHLEGFGGMEGVRKGKGELYDFIRSSEGSVFRNADLDYLKEMAHDIPEQITYGTSNAKIIGKALTSDHFLKVAILSQGLEMEIQTQLAGDYNLPNVLAAVSVGNYFGVSGEDIKSAIEQYSPDNSRSQWIEKGTNKIILDAYNANPSSMKLAIKNLYNIPGKNKWLLLGGMKELGKTSEQEHQAIITYAQELGFNQVLLCGPEFANTKNGTYHWFPDASSLKSWLEAHPITAATLLIKGSRSTKMEDVLPAFEFTIEENN